MNNKEQQSIELSENFLKQEDKQQGEPINIQSSAVPTSTIEHSRIIVFYLDALDEFENRHRSTAPCLYAMVFSIFMGFISSMKSTLQSSLPLLEIMFTSTLMMFVCNFHMITHSNFLPYIPDEKLNAVLKKTALSLMLCLICLIAAVQAEQYQKLIFKRYPQTGVFCFLTGSLISAAFEKYYHTQTFDPQETLMGLISFGGLAFGLDIPQIILTNPGALDIQPIFYGLISGMILVYSGETLKQLQHQNIFTIMHVFGLISIIFLPLFFPIEGLKSPTLFDLVYFCLIGVGILFFLPMLIKAFTIEKQSLIIHYLGWSVPFYKGLVFLFSGRFPSIFELAGMATLITASLILLSFQRVRIHSGSFFVEMEKDDHNNANRPKNPAEPQLWSTT